MITWKDLVRQKLRLSGCVVILSLSLLLLSPQQEVLSHTSSPDSEIKFYLDHLLPSWECDPSTYRKGEWHATLPTTSEKTTDYEICGMKQIPGRDGKLRSVRSGDTLTEKQRRTAYEQILIGISTRVSRWLPPGVERKLTANQLIALWDIEWNVAGGVHRYIRLRDALYSREFQIVANEVVALRAHGGVIEPGLIRRSAWRASQFDPANWSRWKCMKYSRIPTNVVSYVNYHKFLAWYTTRTIK